MPRYGKQRTELAALTDAIEHVSAMVAERSDEAGRHGAYFTDVRGYAFGSPEGDKVVKDAIRLYVETWILPTLESLRESMQGDISATDHLRYTLRLY